MFISMKLLLVSTALVATLLQPEHVASAESANDRADDKDCADQMQEMVSCIPYVSGTAHRPTPQCCADTEKVRTAKPKCLCLLIKESADPTLGLPINTTLALRMPAACNSDADVSNCPNLLKLAPNSPEAKVFQDASGGASANSSPASSTGQDSSDTGTKPKAPSTNAGTRSESIFDVGFLGFMLIYLMHLA